jgi:hypothetical protein
MVGAAENKGGILNRHLRLLEDEQPFVLFFSPRDALVLETVQARVLPTREEEVVVGLVVERVVVGVMNDLVSPKRPTFTLLDDVACERFLLAVDGDGSASLFDPPLSSACSIVSSDEALRLAFPI